MPSSTSVTTSIAKAPSSTNFSGGVIFTVASRIASGLCLPFTFHSTPVSNARHQILQSSGKDNPVRFCLNRQSVAGGSFLGLDFFLLPIHVLSALHWQLAKVELQKKTSGMVSAVVKLYDSFGATEKETKEVAKAVEKLLRVKLKELNKEETKVSVKAYPCVSNGQSNSYDCGMFVCMNMVAIVQGKDPKYGWKQRNMSHCRRRLALLLMNMKAKAAWEKEKTS